MSFKWNRELIENLIINVEQNTCIYNIKSAEYLNRNKKAQAFHGILEEMRKKDAGITMEDLKKKWKNLRTQYMQEIRAISQSKKSGSGRADVYVPKLWCFQQLNFLKMHSGIRQSKDNTQDEENTPCSAQENIQMDNTQDEGNTACNGQDLDVQSEVPRKRRQKTLGAVRSIQKDFESVKSMLQQRKTKKLSFAWLGELVANQMERISPNDHDDATWQVQCLMQRLVTESRARNASTSRDILSQSMEGIFDDEDLNL